MSGYNLQVRNVNGALKHVIGMLNDKNLPVPGTQYSKWRKIAPRGLETLEWKGCFSTEYTHPDERVLFSKARDANPFFHFFESLWILNGSQDVEYLAQFNSNMRSFSDDGVTFHAPYGHRLRHHFKAPYDIDQLRMAIELLKADHDTRQVALAIWDPAADLGKVTKDLPCNDMLFFKIRDGALNLTVACRSNDIIWGAYGANAVQFSVIQEFIARSVGVSIGTYTQVSDSFHVYTGNDAYKRLLEGKHEADFYELMTDMRPYPLMDGTANAEQWLMQLNYFIGSEGDVLNHFDKFFSHVAGPLMSSWKLYKAGDYVTALDTLSYDCTAYDWTTACGQWIKRRMEARGVT